MKHYSSAVLLVSLLGSITISVVSGFSTQPASNALLLQLPSPYGAQTTIRQTLPSTSSPLSSSSSSSSFSTTSTRRFMAAAAAAAQQPQLPPNEFSRLFKTDKISNPRRRANTRDYTLTIEADEEECQALAKRFDLKDLTRLDADVAIRPVMGSSSTAINNVVVQVEGTIGAHLTQTCVRTNEEFQVDVEFPINAIVRPVASFMFGGGGLDLDEISYGDGNADGDDFPKKKKKRNKKNPRRDTSFNEIDMLDLEAQLCFNVLSDDDDGDLDNNMVEDEAIYALGSDKLDVGELVAQTFWLNLDPYPKKPGTGPIEITITG